MRINGPGRVNGPPLVHFPNVILPRRLRCQEVTKMSKKNVVTYDEVFRFLNSKNKQYAEGCTETRKRSIQRFAENISLEDGVLFYLQHEDQEKQTVKSKQQWISDEQKQKQILQSLHDDPAGGCHFGRDKTRDKVVSRYFWHGQHDDIDEYIKTC